MYHYPYILGEVIFIKRFLVNTKQITSENLSSEIEQLLPRNIGNVSWVAIVLLAEKELRQVSNIWDVFSLVFLTIIYEYPSLWFQRSEWFTYLNCLPCMDEMHSAVHTWLKKIVIRWIKVLTIYKAKRMLESEPPTTFLSMILSLHLNWIVLLGLQGCFLS